MSALRRLAILCVAGALFACSGKKRSGQEEETYSKYRSYYVHGEKLYTDNCSNCHQKSGKGLGLVYPPLDSSDFVDNNLQGVLCLMKYGSTGGLTVNGGRYAEAMPGINKLTDIEVAEIATYLYNTWGRNKGIVEVRDVTRMLNACPNKDSQ